MAEESTRSTGGARQALALRFGPVGHGLLGYFEYGLRRAEWPEVTSWASKRFTAASAAFGLSGATIDDLGLEFERGGGGRREAPPLLREIDDLSTPAVYAAGASSVGVCLSLLADRRAATRIALDVYADALRERLRYELALSYSIEHDLHALTADVSHLCVTADVADEHIAVWLEQATTTRGARGRRAERRGARANEGPLPALRPRRAGSHWLGGDVRGMGVLRGARSRPTPTKRPSTTP